MAPATKSLRAALFRPSAPLGGNNPPSVFRGENYVLRGSWDNPYFECFTGNKDLGEDYDIGVVGAKQKETATIIAAAGITADGDLSLVVTVRNSEYAFVLPVTVATHTSASILGQLCRDTLAADPYIAGLYTVSGTGADVNLERLIEEGNDDSLNIYIQPALVNPCSGITNGPVSGTLVYGVQPYYLTGTIAFTSGDNTVSGTGTDFTNELHLGQFLLAGTQLLVVREITDDTHFECDRAPDTSESGLTAYRMPQMFEINGKRGVQLTGNAVEIGQGHKISVGSGELFINGQRLAGASLVASNKAQAAIYRPDTNNFRVSRLGFDNAPPQPKVNVVSGGTRGMVVGNKHSFMVSYWTGSPDGTDGYSDPCTVIKLDEGGSPIEITATDDQFEFDFNDSYVALPANCKGFVIWGSQAGKKTVTSGGTPVTTSTNEGLYENGPWFKVLEVDKWALDANDRKWTFDYLDADLGNEVTGDNDTPADAEFIVLVEGKPMYCSCYGKRTTEADIGSNPGPSCVIGKFDNPDGAPADWDAQVSGTIVGVIEGVGRWFMMTPGSLDFIVPTGLYGQTTTGGRQVELPIVPRPYWKTGAKNRYNIILIDDTLIGFSGNKLFKSVGSGDENVKKYEFGSSVSDITRRWSGGHILTGSHPQETQACFIHAGAKKNDQGYWTTRILPYSIQNDIFLPEIVLSSPTRDMIVCGIATVDEKLEFLCGGRVSGGGIEVKTYRFGAGDDGLTSMPYYLLWDLSDDGLENVSKQIRSIRPTGKFTDCKAQIHGARPGTVLAIEDMEDGINSLGEVAFDDSDEVTRYLSQRVRITNLGMYALRWSGEWNGSGVPDRIDEIVLEVDTHGRSR